MARLYTEAEKGKGVINDTSVSTIKRIRAPRLDNTDLIREHSRTLIGRTTNPQEQRIWALIQSLPRKWNIQGRAEGVDIGNNCFQFKFEKEEDLQKVLENRPYHFNYWMVIIQKWEPVISASFPSQIPFWIKIKGLPLHFWHDLMICNIGDELGSREKHELTSKVARVRVSIDGLKPLVKETIIEFDSGEEAHITLEYERLENHCSFCQRLSHQSSHCPLRNEATYLAKQVAVNYPEVRGHQHYNEERTYQTRRSLSPNASKQGGTGDTKDYPFKARVDRHGRPYGERVSTKQTRIPPPAPAIQRDVFSKDTRREKEISNSAPFELSPQHVKTRNRTLPAHRSDRLSLPQREMLQWREKHPRPQQDQDQEVNSPAPDRSHAEHTPTTQNAKIDQRQSPLGRLPSREEILEDLHETTRQYINCPDPKEYAARRQRVLQGDAQGDMENTADRILAAAAAKLHEETAQSHHQPLPPPEGTERPPAARSNQRDHVTSDSQNSFINQLEAGITTEEVPLRRTARQRIKPARLRSAGTSPNLQGACSKKRNFSRAQKSPIRSLPVGNSTQDTDGQQTGDQGNGVGPSNLGVQPQITLIPAITKKRKDFHAPLHPVP